MKHFFHRFRRLHFVGILGTGMCGIAEVLLRHGLRVTGSDLQENDSAIRLRKIGAEIAIGHSAKNIGDAQVVIYSSACPPDNVELVEARRLNIPVIPRAEMLGELMRLQLGIAVAGVHGKSTTSAMLGAALKTAGMDPTIIVGGRLQSTSGNAEPGDSEWMVAEADEFDRSFLHLMPVHAIITNLEHEHTDTYPTYSEMEDAFVQFANRVPFYGSLAICGDDAGVMAIRPRLKRTVITYGVGPENNIRAIDIKMAAGITTATVVDGSTVVGELKIQVPGIHNLRNALAVITLCRQIEIQFSAIVPALESFTGVARRFDRVGEWNGVTVVDDYAHHPTEVAATLAAARASHRGRIVAVFQPHLFSRTAVFAERFGMALTVADVVFVTDVYPSREKPVSGVTGKLVSDVLRRSGHSAVIDLEKTDWLNRVRAELKPGDMLITMGAGDVTKLAKQMVSEL
ncbi:MAG: UDP-N-acetylmuramate--L-alanine ligase [bacterium]|nr:UDP-N-acetylmuramate--L-alanine ligase [bacterium]